MRQGRGLSILVIKLLVCFLMFTLADSQNQSDRHGLRSFNWACAYSDESSSKKALLRHISFQRYNLLQSLETSSLRFRLYSTPETYCTMLFPLGRSDKAYLIILGYQQDGSVHNRIICCQREENDIKITYIVNIRDSYRPMSTTVQSGSLFDRITANGYVIDGRISNYAHNDLATVRDYAQYTYIPYTDTLAVWLFSNADPKHSLWHGQNVTLYDVDADPATKTKHSTVEFYQKNGLPILDEEVEVLHLGN